MFNVGQHVVCVDDGPTDRGVARPTKGRVYTIRGCGEEPNFKGEYWVLLAEFSNPKGVFGEYGYRSTRFRPIVSRPTSIEFAHEILRSVSAPTKERAHV